jgi:acyl-CoA hydrolase
MSILYAPTDEYSDKLTTPSKALTSIRPGDRIFSGTGCAEPTLLLLQLVD